MTFMYLKFQTQGCLLEGAIKELRSFKANLFLNKHRNQEMYYKQIDLIQVKLIDFYISKQSCFEILSQYVRFYNCGKLLINTERN